MTNRLSPLMSLPIENDRIHLLFPGERKAVWNGKRRPAMRQGRVHAACNAAWVGDRRIDALEFLGWKCVTGGFHHRGAVPFPVCYLSPRMRSRNCTLIYRGVCLIST